jgi:hypothetical protein
MRRYAAKAAEREVSVRTVKLGRCSVPGRQALVSGLSLAVPGDCFGERVVQRCRGLAEVGLKGR